MAVTDAVLEWADGRVRFESDPDASAWARFVLVDLGGWYGGVGTRRETVDRLGHGVIAGRSWRTGRALTLKGHVDVNVPEDRDQVMRDLSGVLWDGLEGDLTATVDGLTLSCRVQIDGEPGIVPTGLQSVTVQVPLAAAEPWLYGPWRESTLQPVGAGVGFEFAPFSRAGVVSFGSAVSTDERIWNEGNAESAPVFTVTADSPGFAVSVGDNRVTYPWPTFLDIPVTVDMAGAVYVGGVDQSHLLGERRWGTVPPGEIESVRFEFLNGGTGWATVRHRDTFI